MAESLVCWKCGASLAALSQPFGRAEVCPACKTDVHVCRQCVFFDPAVSKQCRETIADDVRDKERSNFCGYFKPKSNAYRQVDAAPSRAALDALFGASGSATSTGADKAREDLEKLFGKK
jgi:ribosomal protein L40E